MMGWRDGDGIPVEVLVGKGLDLFPADLNSLEGRSKAERQGVLGPDFCSISWI